MSTRTRKSMAAVPVAVVPAALSTNPLITLSVWRFTVARSLPQINSQPIITVTSACLRRYEVTKFAPALRPARPNLPLNKGLVARPNHPGQPWADLLMGITPGSPDNAAAAGRHVRANPSRPFWQRASMASRPAAVGSAAIPTTEAKFRACLADDQQSRADCTGQTSQERRFAARPRSESIQRALRTMA